MDKSKNHAQIKAKLKEKTDKLVSKDKELFVNLSKEEITEKKKEHAKAFREENKELLNEYKEKNKAEYPERIKGLSVMDNTGERTISFAREGGESRRYTIDPNEPESYENEGDGDSLYAKISKNWGDEFYLVDGKKINDVGNFVVGYYNNVNKEIVIGGQKYPIAVYLKRRDAQSRGKKKYISERDTDVMRYEAYKFCFFDKDIDEFITQDLYKYAVTRGGIRNWAEAMQDGDTLIIDEPESGIYDDGYKVGVRGGKKIFKISALIVDGKIKKAEELKQSGDLINALKLAESVVQMMKEEGIKDLSEAKYLMKICNEYNVKEKSEIANKVLDMLLEEKINYSNFIKQLAEVKELVGSLVDFSKVDKKIDILKKDALEDYLIKGKASDAIRFAKENNLEEELLKNKQKLEESMIDEIASNSIRIVENNRARYTYFDTIKMFLDYGANAEKIKNFLGREDNREILYKRKDFVDQYYIIEQEFQNTIRWYSENQKKTENHEIIKNKFKEHIKDIFEVAEKLGVSKEYIKKNIYDYGDYREVLFPNRTYDSLIKLIDEA